MSSYIAITRKPLFLRPLQTEPPKDLIKATKLLPNPRRARRYFLFLLAFWACLNFSRILLIPSLPACAHDYLHAARKNRALSEFFWDRSMLGTMRVKPCLNFSHAYRNASLERLRPRRKYMMAVVSGGLNQQRNQIIDAVVIARILGAVLVVPVLQVNQVWGDDSEFGDIFDERHFKEALKDDVVVVSSLPSTHLSKRRVRGPLMPLDANEDWVRNHYTPKLGREVVFILRAFDSRLIKNVSADLQRLRCKVAFEALKFQPYINEIAERLVKRMREEGPYMALHLRLEKDVWVRTGCLTGLGKEEDLVVNNERASNPQLLTSRSKLTAQERYLAGLCPLNAYEISRIFKGLTIPKNTRIYWAGGEPFGGEKALEPLRSHFPNLYNKWSLVRPGELNGFEHKPSVLAALDYVVCLRSQVFMANHGGNMARALHEHRTYMGYGRSIKPKKKLLVHLFMNKSLDEQQMAKKIKQIQSEHSQDVVPFIRQYCMCSRKSYFNFR